jgi:uncharacterized protein YggE
MQTEDWAKDRKKLVQSVGLVAVFGSLLLAVMAFSEIKGFQYIGAADPMQTTISVSGEGEKFATPDIAEVTFSIVAEAKTVADAQEKVRVSMEKITGFLKESGVEDKDIKTQNYNFYPKYEWQQARIVCVTYPCPQPEGKQVLTGYEATQALAIKVRKIDDAGKILSGLGERGATNLSGVTFKVDEDEEVKAQARELAIQDAKEKADILARQLGVDLVRIVSFNEGGEYPIYNYARAEMAMGLGGGAQAKDAIIPTGENRYVSNVTIVYEVK